MMDREERKKREIEKLKIKLNKDLQKLSDNTTHSTDINKTIEQMQTSLESVQQAYDKLFAWVKEETKKPVALVLEGTYTKYVLSEH